MIVQEQNHTKARWRGEQGEEMKLHVSYEVKITLFKTMRWCSEWISLLFMGSILYLCAAKRCNYGI